MYLCKLIKNIWLSKMKLKLLSLILIFFLYGCSAASPITEVTNSTSAFEGAFFEGETTEVSKNDDSLVEYRVFQHASDGFEGGSPVRFKAESRANTFCQQRNMAARTIRERAAVPPYILGNFPKIEIIFVCEPSIKRIMTETTDGEKWSQLESLANLLERGIITKEEFKVEKDKIMNKQ